MPRLYAALTASNATPANWMARVHHGMSARGFRMTLECPEGIAIPVRAMSTGNMSVSLPSIVACNEETKFVATTNVQGEAACVSIVAT